MVYYQKSQVEVHTFFAGCCVWRIIQYVPGCGPTLTILPAWILVEIPNELRRTTNSIIVSIIQTNGKEYVDPAHKLKTWEAP